MAKNKDMYSWWWVSHISPKNSKWLQENLTGNVLFFCAGFADCETRILVLDGLTERCT